jgi:excisionase family DNA binding protein
MAATALKSETYLPEEHGQLSEVHAFLRAHEDGYFLVGPSSADRIELPPELYRALRQVVEALRQGLAVTVAPVTQTLTTQQAADLLGVSRPTVIKLVDEGRVPCERVGTHRRILLRDLLAYRERQRAGQYAALEATSVSVDDEEDLQTVLQDLREARRVTAARRRGRPPS